MIISILITIFALPAMILSVYLSRKEEYGHLTLSDMMLENGLIARLMTISMFSVGIFQGIFFLNLSSELHSNIYSILGIVITISFILTPIILLAGNYPLHEITIRLYFLFAYVSQILVFFKIDSKLSIAILIILIINFISTVYLYLKFPRSWKSEVNFSFYMICFYLILGLFFI